MRFSSHPAIPAWRPSPSANTAWYRPRSCMPWGWGEERSRVESIVVACIAFTGACMRSGTLA